MFLKIYGIQAIFTRNLNMTLSKKKRNSNSDKNKAHAKCPIALFSSFILVIA